MQFINTARIVSDSAYVTEPCPSVRLSVPAINRCSSMRRVADVGPEDRRYRLIAARPAPSSNGAAAARRTGQLVQKMQ